MSAYDISKIDVWAGALVDRPGGLAECLEPLAEAGNNFEFVFARRDHPGTGSVFLSPVKGSTQSNVARKAGLTRSPTIHALRIQGPDRVGLSVKVTRALGDAGVNVCGLSGVAVGKQCTMHIAFDSAQDAVKAMRILKKAL